MKTAPKDLEMGSVVAALSTLWGIDGVSLRYVPLGFGSHHWIAEAYAGQQWFITVDDLRAAHLGASEDVSFANLTAAFETAVLLRDSANLPFVIGPVEGTNGEVVYRLNDSFSMAIFPYLDVKPSDFARFSQPGDRNDALRLVGRVHNATNEVSVAGLRRNTLVVPNRNDLVAALRSLEAPWRGGPYSEPARLMLRDSADALHKRLRYLDQLAAEVMADTSGWVVTHGEPHAGNVVRTRSGDPVIVDWDTVAYAPRERDLWMLVDDGNPDWSAYQGETNVTSISHTVMDAYRRHWSLSEIAIYISWCVSPHDRTEEMEIAWASLREYLLD